MDLSAFYIKLSATPEIQKLISYYGIGLGDFVAIKDPTTKKFSVGQLGELLIEKIEAPEGETPETEITITHETLIKSFSVIKDGIEAVGIKEPIIRLFRQDEFQEFVMESCDFSLHKMLVEFNHFHFTYISGEGLSKVFDTFEKCWLYFIMYYLGGKEWDGKKWVKFR